MKKLLFVFFAVICSFGVAANAENVGDVVGKTYNTEIAAYVNNYSIPSYAADGVSVIVAEDLRNCGFDVIWNETERRLDILRNPEVVPTGMTVQKKGRPGSNFMDILHTDIKVYANGIQIPSYAIQGYTVVPVEALTMLGKCEWQAEERAICLWVDDMECRTEKQPVYQMKFEDRLLFENGTAEGYYDLDFDGVWDKVCVKQNRSEENSEFGFNSLKTELIINGKSHVVENAYKTHGCTAVFVADADQADGAIDIFLVMEYKTVNIFAYQYKNGELKQLMCDGTSYFPAGEVTDYKNINDVNSIKLRVTSGVANPVGFYLWTVKDITETTEETDDGYVTHGSIEEVYYCFEKTASGEYKSVPWDGWLY